MRTPQVTDSYPLFPGSCMACQSQNAPGIDTFVDVGVERAQFGRLYLCGRCVGTFAQLLGHVDGDTHAEMRTELAMHKARIVELEDDLEVARAEQTRVVKVDDLRELIYKDRGTD